MYKPYVLQGIVMIVVGLFIFFLLVLPYALAGYPNVSVQSILLYTRFAPAGSLFLILFGAYRIYEAFK